MKLNVPLILASQSPRRKHLLELLGVSFMVDVSAASEDFEPGTEPEVLVEELARRKASDVAARHPDALVLGADTVVVLDGEILNKPSDPDDARHMLRRLSGRTHTVYTGIALVFRPRRHVVTTHETTQVTFAEMTEGEIDAYVAGGSPMDKAGAYGIQDDQGALYIARIDGDYYNVVGLPLHHLYRTLRDNFPDQFVTE